MNKFPGFPKEPYQEWWPYPRALNGWWHTLSGSEQKVLDYILRHTWGFKKNADYISYAQFINGIENCDKGCGLKSPNALSNALKGLEKKGFIRREGGKARSGKTRKYILAFTEEGTIQSNTERSSITSIERTIQPIERSITSIDTIEDISIKDKSIEDIYNHYCFRFKKNRNTFKLSPKRINKIKARLKEFSVKQILTAIDHAADDDFYSGHNDRGWVADLDYITRSYEVMERLVNLVPRKGGGYERFKHPNQAEKGKYDDIIER